ncbi:elmo domain-containing protein b, partial [Phtheirospermum japonicum]
YQQRHRTKVHFDALRSEHQEAVRALWSATYPDQELQSLVSDQWKEMGWQGKDPSTDFRGAGFISLENLLFCTKAYSPSFQSLLRKQAGKRAVWEYPFAVTGVNVIFMIMQMLDLDATKPRTLIRAVFLQMFQQYFKVDAISTGERVSNGRCFMDRGNAF